MLKFLSKPLKIKLKDYLLEQIVINEKWIALSLKIIKSRSVFKK